MANIDNLRVYGALDGEALASVWAELDRLTVIVKEWQLDGTKPFTVHKVPMDREIHLMDGDAANVRFGITDGSGETVFAKCTLTDAPRGTYNQATAFVFTDAFGMRAGFGGAIGMKK